MSEKLKARDLFKNDSENIQTLNDIIVKQKIDFILCDFRSKYIKCRFIKPQTKEINKMLNNLIDMVDQKKELL